LDLAPAPLALAGNVLRAVRTGKFDLVHNGSISRHRCPAGLGLNAVTLMLLVQLEPIKPGMVKKLISDGPEILSEY
jgi:hypothetical protein